jgi:hypothetical protein
MLYLQKINSNKVKNSNEQNKIKVNENKTETKEVNKNLLTNARQLKQSLSNLN